MRCMRLRMRGVHQTQT